jgi:hypothetical protein
MSNDSWLNNFLKQSGTDVSPSNALSPGAPAGNILLTGKTFATESDLSTLSGYAARAQTIFNNGKEIYLKARDKFTETAALKDDLTAAKAFLTEIEKAQQKVSDGLSYADKLFWISTNAKNKALKDLKDEQGVLDAKHVKYSGIVDDLKAQIAALPKPEDNKNNSASKVASDTPSPLTTPAAPPVLNSNTAPVPSDTAGTAGNDVNTVNPQTIDKPSSAIHLTYNVGAVKDAYFSSAKDYLKETTYKGNTPSLITKAAQLWRSAGNSKGMFVMTNPVKNLSGVTPAAGNPGGGAGWSYEAAWVKWGFQFLYNPATVSMTYPIGPAVDYGYLASGQEGANLMGTDGSFGTITFEIILNRMSDMKYYNKTGLLTEAGKEQYGDHVPTARDQMLIYNRGTMYDLEYLLRTAGAGATIQNTWLRGYTADLGFTAAQPIELHLGKNLRYWGSLAAIDVNHTIFNENMIPVFTSVQLTFARLIEPSKKPGSK